MLLLKPIKKPKLRSKAWYKLNEHLQDAERLSSARKRRSLVRSLTQAMASEKTPGSENNRVFPDKRGIHKEAAK